MPDPTEVAATLRILKGRIPATPARALGRLGAPGSAAPQPASDRDPSWLGGLRSLSPLLVERLLGALELTVAGHEWPLGSPETQGPHGRYGWTTSPHHESEATSSAAVLKHLHPALAERTVALVKDFAAHPAIAPLLAVPPEATDEPSIAAEHGAAHLALGVAVAGAVVYRAARVNPEAATIGLGIAAAAALLRETPMPPTYAAALPTKLRTGTRHHRGGRRADLRGWRRLSGQVATVRTPRSPRSRAEPDASPSPSAPRS